MTDGSGRLVATMLEVALAEVAEPERLRRGRRYARQGAVLGLTVEPLFLTAAVQGSRSEPYQVRIRVPRSPRPVSRRGDLVPDGHSLRFECTCPDWEEPCKHAAAVLVAFAERVAGQPDLLVTWRGAPQSAADQPAVAEAADEPADAGDASELEAFLGLDRDRDLDRVVTLTPLPHVQMAWDEPWSVMLHDALRVLAQK